MMGDVMKLFGLSAILRQLSELPQPDVAAVAAWAAREPTLTKPAGSLGRLEEVSRHLCAWQGRHPPRADAVATRVFAGNHGIAAKGVSAFPADVTAQMVRNFQTGGASINQLCRVFGSDLAVVPIALDRPTIDFSEAPAMSEAECVAAFEIGMDSVPDGLDLLVLGEMGIANTTSAAAICNILFGGAAEDWTGRGTGVDDKRLATKVAAVARAAALHGPHKGLEVLRRVGGRELAAIAGATLAGRLRRLPVILDGYVCCAAVAPLFAVAPQALDHCLIGHVSAEPGHQRLLDRLGKRALLALDMRLGEASGAALAVAIVKAAVACHTGMASFAEAGIAGKETS
jgi:nicotinate-nucleotide--dimethylbenzimidazole phosphoribosyltransferase